MDYQGRRQRLFEQTDATIVALVPGTNLDYFTGLHFHLSERPLIAFLQPGSVAVLVPELEVDSIDAQQDDIDGPRFIWSDGDGYEQAFREAVAALDLANTPLHIDGRTMRAFEWLALSSAGATLPGDADLGTQLQAIRAVKSATEIAVIRKAIAISEEALRRTLRWVEPGKTEREIARYLEATLTDLGAEGFAFDTAVQVGERTYLPHGGAKDTVLQENDFLLIDFGGKIDGYMADITRTVCVGTPSEEMRKIHETVQAANAAGKAAARAGVTGHDVDAAARGVIEEAGYGAYFRHRTGHGLGLDVHELPNMAPNDSMILTPGMVFTVEPGVYVPGVGGVRIEDDVLITEDGCESLTAFPRSLTLDSVRAAEEDRS